MSEGVKEAEDTKDRGGGRGIAPCECTRWSYYLATLSSVLVRFSACQLQHDAFSFLCRDLVVIAGVSDSVWCPLRQALST